MVCTSRFLRGEDITYVDVVTDWRDFRLLVWLKSSSGSLFVYFYSRE